MMYYLLEVLHADRIADLLYTQSSAQFKSSVTLTTTEDKKLVLLRPVRTYLFTASPVPEGA